MDADRFDALIQHLGSPGTRRRTLGALLGGALGLLGLAAPDETWAESGKCKRPCGACERCKKGSCQRKNGRKRCKAGKCKPKKNGTACGNGKICQSGACVCPSGTVACDGVCADIVTDRANCGACGSACLAPNSCLNGGCAATCAAPSPPGGCSGASCAGPTCPGGGSCGNCDTTTEGQVVCGDLGPPCEELQECTTSADCPLGSVCVTNGCCTFAGKPNVCVRLV